MATGKKVSELTRITNIPTDSMFHIIQNPDGSPAGKGIFANNFFANVSFDVVHSTSYTFTIKGKLTLFPMTRPSGPANGQIYFDSSDSHFYGYNGTTWTQLDN